MKTFFATNQFPGLNFLGIHNKPHGVSGLGKHCYMRYGTKLVHVTYIICCISCACT